MQNCEENYNEEINTKTWDKLHQNATKFGYREGVAQGRDSNFQNYFDQGFTDGFKNGFALGMYKGYLSSDNKISNDSKILLQNISRANCVICKNGKDEMQDLNIRQIKSTNDVLRTLYSKHLLDSEMNLPKEIN